MTQNRFLLPLAACLLAAICSIPAARPASADDPSASSGAPNTSTSKKTDTASAGNPDPRDSKGRGRRRQQRLTRYLSGSTFTGHFTIDGKSSDKLKEESYKILSCEKIDGANRYKLVTEIKYGETDGQFPMELTILWAGGTPVITLDQVWVPGLGTFSGRVLIHDGRYAGTWQHEQIGGHLFGKIQPANKNAKTNEKKTPQK